VCIVENFDESLTFILDNGQEVEYAIDAYFEMNGKKYALLSSEQETTIMQVIDEDNDYFFSEVPDEEVKKIFEAYQQALQNDVKQ
jgi:hypothetical protein